MGLATTHSAAVQSPEALRGTVTDSGNTARINAYATLTTALPHNATLRQQVYYARYYFNLFSNFPFFKEDPYTRPRYQVGPTVQNLLNAEWDEAQFATGSRLRGETASVNEINFTPGTPCYLKLNASVFF